jgi:hypothetical protein
MSLFTLSNGPSVQVDPDVCEQLHLLGRNWQAAKRGKTWYASNTSFGDSVYMHRWILGFPSGRVDHVNGDGLDNKRSNLRIATARQNGLNRVNVRHHGRVDYRGVDESSSDTFRAYATGADGMSIHLGSWPTAELAACARDLFVSVEQPEATLNFPGGSPYSAADVACTRLSKRAPASGAAMVRLRRGRWEACARVDGRRVYLGTFASKEQAIAAQRGG